MKILIIATPRSGSTVLTEVVSVILKYIKYDEPYSSRIASKEPFPKILPENVVVKTMLIQVPIGQNDNIKFYIEEIKNYDRVILLSRLDVKSSYESFNYMFKNNFEGNWHKQYTYGKTEKNIELFSNYLTWTNDLIKFSQKINVPITWYEDIYDNKDEKVVKNWNLDLDIKAFYKQLNKHPRYRVENLTKRII